MFASGCHDHLAQLSSLASRLPWIFGGLSTADLLRGGRGHAGAARQVVEALRAGRQCVARPPVSVTMFFFLNGEFDGKKIMGFWENLRNSWQFMGFFGVIFDLRVNFLGMEAAISWGYRGFLCDDHPIPKHG